MARDDATSRTIARRLGLSERTVDDHLAAVYRKLGVRRRRELLRVLSPDRALHRLLAGGDGRTGQVSWMGGESLRHLDEDLLRPG